MIMEQQKKVTKVSTSDLMMMAAIIRGAMEIAAQIGPGGYSDINGQAVKIAKELCKRIAE